MGLFSNRIDKKALNFYGNYYNLPVFLFQKKYLKFLKNNNIELYSLNNLKFTEEQLNNYISIKKKYDVLLPLSLIYLCDDELIFYFNFNIDSNDILKMINHENVHKFKEIIFKSLSCDYIKNNLSVLDKLVNHDIFIEFLTNDNISSSKKEEIINPNIVNCFELFGIDFSITYLYLLDDLYKLSDEAYFNKVVEFIKQNSRDVNNQIIKFIFEIRHNFVCFSNDDINLIVEYILENPSNVSFVQKLFESNECHLTNLFLRNHEIFKNNVNIDQELLKKYEHFNDFLFSKFNIYNKKNIAQSCLINTNINYFLKNYEFNGKLDSNQLGEYSYYIDLLYELNESNDENTINELYQTSKKLKIDLDKLKPLMFEKFVLPVFNDQLLNVNDSSSISKFPVNKGLYPYDDVEIITINDYPFNLFVTGISRSNDSFAGTSSVSYKISDDPKIWMDMNIEGQNLISMSRINEINMFSWGENEGEVICGFSSIDNKQLVEFYLRDSGTSRDLETKSIKEPNYNSLDGLLSFFKREEPNYTCIRQYEEIRSNRYKVDENGELKKFPPDYMVYKGDKSNIPVKTYEWAKLYGRKIVVFDYDAISKKAITEFMNIINMIKNGELIYDEETKNKLFYLNNIISYFCSDDIIKEQLEREHINLLSYIDDEKNKEFLFKTLFSVSDYLNKKNKDLLVNIFEHGKIVSDVSNDFIQNNRI